ncbi:MAG TPA: hypothetical protein VMG12_42360 [Polyangiaceae bacterium]|nr:hypothetical protein [Polyangiaceae bacterium]
MPGPACCLLAAFIASGSVVEVAAGVDGEVAAGRAPVQLTGPEENSLTFTLVPGVGLRLRSLTNTLSLAYTPRVFYRVPNQLDVSRPLLLHQLQLNDTLLTARNMAWTSTAGLSVGELDYTASGLFPVGSSAVRAAVVDIVRAEGQTGFSYDITRRFRWTADVSAQYTTPLDDDAPATPPPVTMDGGDFSNLVVGTVPESAQVSGRSSFSYALSRQDRVAANGEVTYQWFPDTGRFLLLSPDLSWERQLSKQTTLALSGGFAYVITLATADGSNPGDALGGTGSIQLNSELHRARNVRVSANFASGIDWFFDPIAGTSQPRASVDAGSTIDIGREWSIGPNASFYTVIRGASTTVGGETTNVDGMMVPVASQAITPDATQVRAEVPVTYRLSDLVLLNFGVRGALRGRALSQSGFRLDERYEIWAFFGLTVRLTSGEDNAMWLAL